MIGLGSFFLHSGTVPKLLSEMDNDTRTALICWGIVLSAFIIFRVPREVFLGCLIAAVATVGIAVAVIDTASVQTTADATPSSRHDASSANRRIHQQGPTAWRFGHSP